MIIFAVIDVLKNDIGVETYPSVKLFRKNIKNDEGIRY